MARYRYSNNGWRTREPIGQGEPPPPVVDRSTLVPGTYKPSLGVVGVLPGVTRSSVTGNRTISSATTIQNENLSAGKISIGAGATGTITIKNVFFHGLAAISSGNDSLIRATSNHTANVVIEDCTFWPDVPNKYTSGILGHHFTLRRCLFINVEDGVQIYNTNNVNAAVNVTIEGCYIDRLAFWQPDANNRPEGSHNDCIQIQGGNVITIRGNLLSGMKDPNVGDYGPGSTYYPSQTANAAIQILEDVGTNIHTVTIDRNWMYGGGATVNLYDGGSAHTGFAMTDNKFANSGQLNSPRIGWDALISAATYDAGTITGNTREDGTAAAIQRS